MAEPTTEKPPLQVFIIAGEASGDLLGAHLMRSLREKSDRPIRFYGIGGPRMAAEGLDSLFPFYELSMLGFIEVLPFMFNIAVRIRQTVDDVVARNPDLVITIDVPGFSMRVVERLRQEKNLKAKFVHYVAPTVWAYKAHRAEKCARLFDHLLVLLPFEPPYFEKVGLPCTWVGHPVIVETPMGDGAAFRAKFGIAPDAPLFCLMPGSRKGEVERHMPILARSITMLAAQFPGITMAVAVPPNVMPFVAPFFENCPFKAIVTSDEEDKKGAIAASNLAIVKSGTVALEIARAGVPMIVTYQLHAISAWYLRRHSLIRYVSLVNVLEGKEVIPELLQELCNPLMIASAAAYLYQHPGRQEAQKRKQKSAVDRLIPTDGERPSDKAARTILGLL